MISSSVSSRVLTRRSRDASSCCIRSRSLGLVIWPASIRSRSRVRRALTCSTSASALRCSVVRSSTTIRASRSRSSTSPRPVSSSVIRAISGRSGAGGAAGRAGRRRPGRRAASAGRRGRLSAWAPRRCGLVEAELHGSVHRVLTRTSSLSPSASRQPCRRARAATSTPPPSGRRRPGRARRARGTPRPGGGAGRWSRRRRRRRRRAGPAGSRRRRRTAPARRAPAAPGGRRRPGTRVRGRGRAPGVDAAARRTRPQGWAAVRRVRRPARCRSSAGRRGSAGDDLRRDDASSQAQRHRGRGTPPAPRRAAWSALVWAVSSAQPARGQGVQGASLGRRERRPRARRREEQRVVGDQQVGAPRRRLARHLRRRVHGEQHPAYDGRAGRRPPARRRPRSRPWRAGTSRAAGRRPRRASAGRGGHARRLADRAQLTCRSRPSQ